MAKNIECTLEQTAKKSSKSYKPLSFEVVTFGEDAILSSTFNTKGIYDDDWIIFDNEEDL